MNLKAQKIINETPNCGISLNSSKTGYVIYIDNSCGEDFEIEIEKSNSDAEILAIINYCDNYDADEHFHSWYGADRGEPSDARALLDNCEEIGETLRQLSSNLYSYLYF
ncbi:MAG: hypothetical protein J6T10_21750 [Methanobrevibacter sp.]|nr:hypothetical protein [Methanobrevibacter sp.]